MITSVVKEVIGWAEVKTTGRPDASVVVITSVVKGGPGVIGTVSLPTCTDPSVPVEVKPLTVTESEGEDSPPL